MLGFEDATCALDGFTPFLYFGIDNDTSPTWMRNVQCFGNESALDLCSFDGWGGRECDFYEYTGVVCSDGNMQN